MVAWPLTQAAEKEMLLQQRALQALLGQGVQRHLHSSDAHPKYVSCHTSQSKEPEQKRDRTQSIPKRTTPLRIIAQ